MAATLIRWAKPSDAETLFPWIVELEEVEAAEAGDLSTEKPRLSEAISRQCVRVAEAGGKPVGFLWFSFTRKPAVGLNYPERAYTYCFVEYLLVHPEYRGKGIGSSLYDDVERLCREQGVSRLVCDVFKANSRSVSYHERRGFKELVGLYLKKLGD